MGWPIGWTRLGVLIPQTPKGVEHISAAVGYARAVRVLIPQTPKGVEHIVPSLGVMPAIAGANSSDAQRR